MRMAVSTRWGLRCRMIVGEEAAGGGGRGQASIEESHASKRATDLSHQQ